MEKTNITIGIIVVIAIVVIIAGSLIYFPNKKTIIIEPVEQECSKSGGYCVYNNIPTYLQYSEPEWFYDDVSMFEGDLTQYLVRDDSPNRLSEVFSGDWSSYVCVDTGNPPVIIEYFYDLCEWVEEGAAGCWHERRAVICGEVYFVQDFTSSYGPRLYGPFPLPLED